jgi:hypothetical protein
MKYILILSFVLLFSMHLIRAKETMQEIIEQQNKGEWNSTLARNMYKHPWVQQFGTHFFKYYTIRTGMSHGGYCNGAGKEAAVALLIVEEGLTLYAQINTASSKVEEKRTGTNDVIIERPYRSANFLAFLIVCLLPTPQAFLKAQFNASDD